MIARPGIQLKPTKSNPLLSDGYLSEERPHQLIKQKHTHADIFGSVIQAIEQLEEHQLFRGGIGLPANLLGHHRQLCACAGQLGSTRTGPQCGQSNSLVQWAGT